MLNEIIQVRRKIGDPITTDFLIVDDLPAEPLIDTAYTIGDGVYQYFDGVDWRLYSLKFSDNYISELINKHGILRACIRLIDNLIARIDPTVYLSSANTGGQSMSFQTLSEVLDFYNRLRDRLLEEEAEEAGMNSGLMLNTKKKPIGGVQEYE